MESEHRRREMSRVYNSYVAARSKYSIDDIPMPDSSEGDCLFVLFHITLNSWNALIVCGLPKTSVCL